MEKEHDVVVIGAGLGGLSAATNLSKNGLKTLLVEKHARVGGYCCGFKRKGFTFDCATEAFLAAGKDGSVKKLLESLGIEIEFKRLDPVTHCIYPEHEFDIPKDLEEYEEMLGDYFPEEKKSITRYFNTMNKIYEQVMRAMGKEEPTNIFSKLLFAIKNIEFVRNIKKSFQAMLDEHFKDEKLKSIMAHFSGWTGLPPSGIGAIDASITVANPYKFGLYYPMGGMQAFSDKIAAKFKEYGGTLLTNTPFSKIIIQNGKVEGVELAEGEKVKANEVISNADLKQTFLKLVGKDQLDEEFASEIEDREQSITGFLVYLGVDMELSIASHNSIYSSYDKYEMFEELKRGELNFTATSVVVPSLIDSSMAPKGMHSMFILTLAPYNYKNYWMTENGKRGEAYYKLKDEVANKLIKKVEETLIPNLSKHIVVKDAATPMTLERYTWNKEGAWYGPRLPFRTWEALETSMLTPIEGLYLAGHNNRAGGMPMALISGFMTANRIIEKGKKH